MAVDYIEEALYSVLAADETVSGLVGTRIYPLSIPDNAAMPAVVYQRISGAALLTMDGAHSMTHARFQLNCWSDEYGETRDLSDAVRQCLDGYSGDVGNVSVLGVFVEGEIDLGEIVPDVETSKRHAKALDFFMWYRE
jgi:hypothetical protein